jgi:hypothetical protein
MLVAPIIARELVANHPVLVGAWVGKRRLLQMKAMMLVSHYDTVETISSFGYLAVGW